MKVLFFITGHRHLREYESQRRLFENFPQSFDFDVIVYSNSSIKTPEISELIGSLKQLKSIHSCMPNSGYLYGGVHCVRDAYHLFQDYDFVVQHHPDVFIVDPRRAISCVKNAIEWNFDMLLSYMVHYHGEHGIASPINNTNLYYNTDFFGFNPRKVNGSMFDFSEGAGAEVVFTKRVKESGHSFLIHDRSRLMLDGLYSYTANSLGEGPDFSGIWHCHDIEKIERMISK